MGWYCVCGHSHHQYVSLGLLRKVHEQNGFKVSFLDSKPQRVSMKKTNHGTFLQGKFKTDENVFWFIESDYPDNTGLRFDSQTALEIFQWAEDTKILAPKRHS